uniref:Myb/SANT-like domain-containing protein n=1 Tax=Oryza punctata TaxID=4537 RepID=A0A0E0LJE0_ORYPU
MAEAGGANGAQGGHQGVLRWTANMSSFMLRRMVELIAQGVKTDKGFKEVHLNQVARTVSEHYGFEISGTQVYNHLRKWRTRWVRITRLKDISGALWDDQLSMIVLDEEHYMMHIKDHVKDAEYLNVPLENYTQMAIIFGNGQATGRFAMGSNEALGNPVDMADSGLGPTGGIIGDGIAAGPSGVGAEGGGTAARASGVGPTGDEPTGGSNSDKKRKRTPALDEGEVALISNMTDSVNKVASAILATAHTEVHPDLENSVMDLPGFSEDQLDLVLSHLTKHKAESLVYIQKNEARRARWVKKFLEEHHPESI